MEGDPGKYDAICTVARETAHAEGAIVAIFNGDHGSGFSVQGTLELNYQLPDILEFMAKQIREQLFHGENDEVH